MSTTITVVSKPIPHALHHAMPHIPRLGVSGTKQNVLDFIADLVAIEKHNRTDGVDLFTILKCLDGITNHYARGWAVQIAKRRASFMRSPYQYKD